MTKYFWETFLRNARQYQLSERFQGFFTYRPCHYPLPLLLVYAVYRREIYHHAAVSGATDGNISQTLLEFQGNLGSCVESPYAYVTFLAGDASTGSTNETENMNSDNYFLATRLLAYQILHAPETRITHSYDLVVLVTPQVSEAKRQRLRADGASVIEVHPLETASWVVINNNQWADVLSKLRLWELTQYDRVCFLDADVVLTRSLDGVFSDLAVSSQPTLKKADGIHPDEAALPEDFVFASQLEMNKGYHYPPTEDGRDWPNMQAFSFICCNISIAYFY